MAPTKGNPYLLPNWIKKVGKLEHRIYKTSLVGWDPAGLRKPGSLGTVCARLVETKTNLEKYREYVEKTENK